METITAVLFGLFILVVSLTLFNSIGRSSPMTDYELFGMDAEHYGKYMQGSEEFRRGFDSAKKGIDLGGTANSLLKQQAGHSLSSRLDDFDNGWIYYLENLV